MTKDDLTTRLRAWPEPRMEILRNLLDEAAARIEALEADFERALDELRGCAADVAARDAVITAALALAEEIGNHVASEYDDDPNLDRMIAELRALARVPQGAAEPTRCTCDGGANFTEAENLARIPFITNDDCLIHGHLHREGAATVASGNASGFNPSWTIFDQAWQNISGRDDLWGGCARRDEVLAEVERLHTNESLAGEVGYPAHPDDMDESHSEDYAEGYARGFNNAFENVEKALGSR